MSIDSAISNIPENYRLYSIDASIPNRFSVMLALTGEDYALWHAQGATLDLAGRDIRPKLFASGVAKTLDAAINAAIEDVRNMTT